jgi:hypothetical protein
MMRLLLLTLLALAGCTGSAQEFECYDYDPLNRGGSEHVVGPLRRGSVVDAVWCGDDETDAGFTCEDRYWWVVDGEIVVDCPTVDEGADRGWLWVRVEGL